MPERCGLRRLRTCRGIGCNSTAAWTSFRRLSDFSDNSHPGLHQPYVPPRAVRLVNGPTKPDRLCPRGGLLKNVIAICTRAFAHLPGESNVSEERAKLLNSELANNKLAVSQQ